RSAHARRFLVTAEDGAIVVLLLVEHFGTGGGDLRAHPLIGCLLDDFFLLNVIERRFFAHALGLRFLRRGRGPRLPPSPPAPSAVVFSPMPALMVFSSHSRSANTPGLTRTRGFSFELFFRSAARRAPIVTSGLLPTWLRRFFSIAMSVISL